jgi:hypothetical protein
MMVLLDTFMTNIISSLYADLTKGDAGTSTTLPDESQTALIAEVAATKLALSNMSQSLSSIYAVHSISTGVATGSMLAEYAILGNGDALMYSRITRAQTYKNALDLIQISHEIEVDRNV